MSKRLYVVTLHPEIANDNQPIEIMDKTIQQQEATRFSFDYLRYLLQQEVVIERMVDRKIAQLEPRIDKMISKKIEQQMKKQSSIH